MDVAVTGDKIAAAKPGIPVEGVRKVVDASGLYVTPGLIDIHAHVGHGGAPLDWFSPQARAHQPPLGIYRMDSKKLAHRVRLNYVIPDHVRGRDALS